MRTVCETSSRIKGQILPFCVKLLCPSRSVNYQLVMETNFNRPNYRQEKYSSLIEMTFKVLI